MPNSFHKRTTILAKSTILLSSILVFGSILGVAITTNVYANEIVSTVTVNLSSSCTMTSNTKEAHSATFSGSETKSNVGLTNFTVTCNDAGGFGIYAVGGSNNTEGNTNLVGSSGNIATGLATEGATSNWAMRVHKADGDTTYDSSVSVVNGFDSENYHVVPSSYTRIAEKSSGISLGSTVSVSATYRIFIASGQPAGTYTGLVKYALAHPSTKDCPEGYELDGGVCKEIAKTISTITNMQEMTSAICTASTENETKQLKDTRDNKLYWVAKLKDGNCWMTQNLDYDISSSTNTISNLDGTTGTWTSSSTYPPQQTTTSVFNNSTYTGTYSYDPGSKYLPNGTGSATSINCTSSSNGGENCHYHLGNYYQWNAATAGSGGTISSTDANSSICPAGWRLPTSNSYTNNYSFGKLTNAYGITSSSAGSSDSALLSSPLWFVRAGAVNDGSLNYQGTYGFVWSSQASSLTSSAYNLRFGSTGVNPSDNDSRYYGFSVRCVAQ